jgi:hypothetical protein
MFGGEVCVYDSREEKYFNLFIVDAFLSLPSLSVG